jgi:hypothetical protein
MTEQAPQPDGPPPDSPYDFQPAASERLPEIGARDLREAQRDPQLHKLLMDAEEEDRQLERDGRIHR